LLRAQRSPRDNFGVAENMTWLGIFVAALILRLAYLATFRPPFDSVYWELATSILQDRSLAIDRAPIIDFEPLYPLFLAATRLLVGDDPLGSQVVQAAVASLGTIFIYRLAVALTGRSSLAMIAAGLFACHPLLVRQAPIASDLWLASTLVVAFAYLFVWASSPRRMTIAGFVLGLVLLTRSMTLPLLVFAPLVLLSQRRLKEAACLTLVAGLMFTPYVVRNRIVSGSWTPTRSGLNLYIGNAPHTAALLPAYDLDLLQDHAHVLLAQQRWRLESGSAQYASAANQFFTDQARTHITDDAFRAARNMAQKAIYLFWPVLVPYYVAAADTYLIVDQNGEIRVRNAVPRPKVEVFAYSLFYVPVLLTGVIGVYLRRREWRADAILWCTVATFVGVHAIYFPATRYRAPIAFVLLFYAAVACHALGMRLAPQSCGARCEREGD
jgi:hypothetical protein